MEPSTSFCFSGSTRSSQVKPGLQARGEVAEAAGRGAAGAEVEVVRRRHARRRGCAAAMHAISAASAIWPSESRNLAGASPVSSVPASAAQASLALAEARHRRVERERDGVAERGRGAARAGQQQHALGARVQGAHGARALDGLEPVDAVEHEPRARPGRRPGRRRAPASPSSASVTGATSTGWPSATASSAGASGPASTIGIWLGAPSRARRSATTVRRPGSYGGGGTSRMRPSPSRRRVELAGQQERGQPLGDLRAALGERRGPAALVEQAQRAEPPQRPVGLEAREHVGRA